MAGVGGRSIYSVMNQHFSCSSLLKEDLTWQCPGDFKFESDKTRQVLLLHKYQQNSYAKRADGNLDEI